MANANIMTIEERHLERKRKRMRQMKRRRITTMSTLALIFLLIILLFTPLFKIKKVNIEGIQKSEKVKVEEVVNDSVGRNLFRYKTKSVSKKLKKIPYIKDVKFKKSLFPCRLNLEITECVPVAFVAVGEKLVILDESLKVLEVVEKLKEPLPEIEDVEPIDIKLGESVQFQSENLTEFICESLKIFKSEDLIKDIDFISYKDLNKIKFNYQNRLDVICGDREDFKKKIVFFKQAINSSSFTENSRGTIDLSEKKEARYIP